MTDTCVDAIKLNFFSFAKRMAQISEIRIIYFTFILNLERGRKSFQPFLIFNSVWFTIVAVFSMEERSLMSDGTGVGKRGAASSHMAASANSM